MDLLELQTPLEGLCQKASHAILDVYARPWEEQDIHNKADSSPLTAADLASHHILQEGLEVLGDGWPVVSEEGQSRHASACYWLVDPLDGTKEFLKRNGEFTVNVALVQDGRPVLGFVQVPVTGTCYFGVPGKGAWRRQAGGPWSPIQSAAPPSTVRAVVSKSHRGEAVDQYLDALRQAGHVVEDVSYGSSLKLCRVAEGEAHVYPRLGPTMPWDTAAAHAVAKAAGATVTDVHGRELQYRDPQARNPWFIVGAPGTDWAAFATALEA